MTLPCTDDHKTFADIDKYIKDWLFFYGEENYWKVSPFADGNCGLYAFACGFVDSIITHQLTLDDKKFNEFRAAIAISLNLESEQISEFKYELESETSKFQALISQPDLTFPEFKDFLIQHLVTRESLAAINLILGQGLRFIGVTNYIEFCEKEMGIKEKDSPKRDKKLSNTGEWVGNEILVPLARYFDISINLINKYNTDKENSFKYRYVHQNSLEDKDAPPAPVFNLLLENNHWHYLIPEKKENGITNILSLRQELESDKQKSFNFTRTTLENLASVLKQIFDFLVAFKAIFNRHPNQAQELKQAKQQAEIKAKESTQIINSWREQWSVSNDQLDGLGLYHELEKALIKDPLITDDSEDATMAAILQNADIVDFLLRNYATLKRFNPPINPYPDVRNHNQLLAAHDLKNVAPCIF